jgi:2-polyprenyl-3-methyl-5-hydroxy-6-metoxy-1,4-benzoquinol methylase
MQAKFSQRSAEAELLDAPGIPRQLLFQNLRELDLVNRTLGGHTVSIIGIKKLLSDQSKVYTIVDIGCGGGDVLLYIARWARKNNFRVQLIGVDKNEDAIDYVNKKYYAYPEIIGIVSDYKDFLNSNPQIDVIHCSLFCHHLTNEELKELFACMHKKARAGFIINDLHRHWIAYYSILFLTRLLKGSSLVKNDAPLSVLRGFKKKELLQLWKEAVAGSIEIRWKWAFRYLMSHKQDV